jgi:DNA gyrase subunit A
MVLVKKASKEKKAVVVEGRAGDNDALSCMRICRNSDEVVISTMKGTVVRQRVADMSIQSRTATGVLIQKLDKDDKVIMVDIVPGSSTIAASAVDSTSSSHEVLTLV